MDTNASRYARHARADKVRLKYGPLPQAAMEAEVRDLCKMLAGDRGVLAEEMYFNDIALHAWRDGEDIKGWTIQLHGQASLDLINLPERYIGRVSELEAKAYLEPLAGNASQVEWFFDALQSSRGTLRLTIDQPSRRQGPKKKGASRHARMGTEKSSVSISTYARQDERLGLNIGTRKVRLAKIRSDVMGEFVNRSGPGLLNGQGWRALMYRCALAAYQFYEKELTNRGIRLVDYFSHFTNMASTDATQDTHPDSFTTILGVEGQGGFLWQMDISAGLGTVPAVDADTGEVLSPPLDAAPDTASKSSRKRGK